MIFTIYIICQLHVMNYFGSILLVSIESNSSGYPKHMQQASLYLVYWYYCCNESLLIWWNLCIKTTPGAKNVVLIHRWSLYAGSTTWKVYP